MDLLEDFERQYPPRCLAKGETVEEHLRYAGKVELVSELRRYIERDDE